MEANRCPKNSFIQFLSHWLSCVSASNHESGNIIYPGYPIVNTGVGMLAPREAAERLKAEGNAAFQKEKYGAAVDRYTEAILLCPDWPVLFTNRALCQIKRGKWEDVERDSKAAIDLDPYSMKAHYCLGQALREREDESTAIKHLSKALELARQKGDAIRDQIWRELAKAKYGLWQKESAIRRAEMSVLRERLEGLLKADHEQALSHEVDSAARAKLQISAERETAALNRLFDMASKSNQDVEPDNAYTCRLTMEVFREPVITPSGLSYEQSALQEHLAKVGGFDPVTREPMTASQAIPNLALRAATEQYLDEHPWAWADVA